MKILVTGNLGYVGNVLTRMLLEQKFDVIGCDTGFYPQGFLDLETSECTQIKKDIRNLSVEDLKGVSVICHLAALSNDPLGEINPNLTEEINYNATIRLAKLAKEAKVEKFIFSSSCSSYGMNENTVNEESDLAPLTAYAKSKVNSEREISKLSDSNFCTTNLRSATAYGLSNSIRLDLVVNNLTCSAFTTNQVKLLSDGTAWRPLVHVEDMSNAFISVLNAKNSEVNSEAFNVGTNDDNYTVREIAQKVEQIVPNSTITYAEDVNKDSRSYKVDFSKIKQTLGYKTKWSLDKAIKEIYDLLKIKKFTEEDFKDKKYYRVAYIKWLIENKKIDNNLFIN
jgi:nucleoside-diphosphate-sugar epimerase